MEIGDHVQKKKSVKKNKKVNKKKSKPIKK